MILNNIDSSSISKRLWNFIIGAGWRGGVRRQKQPSEGFGIRTAWPVVQFVLSGALLNFTLSGVARFGVIHAPGYMRR